MNVYTFLCDGSQAVTILQHTYLSAAVPGPSPAVEMALWKQAHARTQIKGVLSGEIKGSASQIQHSCYQHADKLAESACLLRP